MTKPVDSRELTPPYARYFVRFIRPFPNFDFFFIKSLRQKAVQMLELKPEDRVLDVGCGPGGCFPYLVHAVGPSGLVVGIEISPEVTINARKRIEKNGWSNVQVITADARTVKLNGTFDGLLMFAAADIYASPQALENLFPYLKSDARVCAFGVKLSRRRSGKMFNSFFRSMVSKLSFPSAPDFLNYEPWNLLENRVGKLEVEEYFFGSMFLAWGTIQAGSKS
ncbi:MAG TPA: methyltransferase domain-containing protein [candidate division Zixibacteria bacterium]|nr:methyltransferase domain-containing protein [candidate division Zixibacteria bacterium]